MAVDAIANFTVVRRLWPALANRIESRERTEVRIQRGTKLRIECEACLQRALTCARNPPLTLESVLQLRTCIQRKD
ncbi:hypothetical protein EVAR_91981_1 [Eumeta japonica]|uniref:Uncharacterized protein n=1 Tax=Eumeta variegata TaxID=151549 RepID=A0A4C2AAU5_EUMVA|nr:hypothetical protein EVAR_91981_1 [Eumeta japonica]